DRSAQRRLIARAVEIGNSWTELPGIQQRAFLTILIDRIDVRADQIDIHLRPTRLAALLELPAALAGPPQRRNHCVVRASRLSLGLALRKSDWQKIPMRKARQAVLEFAGREVVITNPDK